MKRMIQQLMKDESGASLIEYLLLAAIIGVGALVGMRAIRTAANTSFTTTAGTITTGQ